MPVLLTLLGKVGLVTSSGLVTFRKYAVVSILILAALVTPPDVITQIILFSAVYTLYEISSHQYIIPGFTDLHIHAPQWPQLGKALDVPLEEWLQKYTFPLEAKYHDENFARMVYSDLVSSLLKSGTTTAVYYGTIHKEANRILADICLNKGQRAIIGKVVMDNPEECPEYYRDVSTQSA